MTVLITGGEGFIGSALCTQIMNNEFVVSLDKEVGRYIEGNVKYVRGTITDLDILYFIKNTYHPDKIIHCAANKYIDRCETEPNLAIDDNIIGTRQILDCYKDTPITFISTDKATNPSTIYGYSKAICERMVLKHEAFSCVVRLGNVLKSTGSVLAKWEQNPEKIKVHLINGKIPKRYFISIWDCIKFIQDTKFEDKHIFVPKMPNISIEELAQQFASKHNSVIEYIDMKNEKVEETLFNESELNNIVEYDTYFVCNYYK